MERFIFLLTILLLLIVRESHGQYGVEYDQNVKRNVLGKSNLDEVVAKRDNLGRTISDISLPSLKRFMGVSLENDPGCAEDINRYCKHVRRTENVTITNMKYIHCLSQSTFQFQLLGKCERSLLSYKMILTDNMHKFINVFENKDCMMAAENIPHCRHLNNSQDEMVLCLLEEYGNVNNKKCEQMLQAIATLFIQDYRYSKHFLQVCATDMNQLNCVSNRPAADQNALHQQMDVLNCLTEKFMEKNGKYEFQSKCIDAVRHLRELESQDFHLDKRLYFACQRERDVICGKVKSGDGRVFRCLSERRNDDHMSQECDEAIQFIQRESYLLPMTRHSLVNNCHVELKESKCMEIIRDKMSQFNNFQASGNPDIHYGGTIADLLICLQKHFAENPERSITKKCSNRLVSYQTMLMNDYQMSPLIVSYCNSAIVSHCRTSELDDNTGKHGQVLNCLLNMARSDLSMDVSKRLLPVNCIGELQKIVEAAQPNKLADMAVDPHTLYSCDLEMKKFCPHYMKRINSYDRSNTQQMLSCLQENIYKDDFSKRCFDQISLLNFFILRDWVPDIELQKNCAEDATRLCGVRECYLDKRTEEGQFHAEFLKKTLPDNKAISFQCRKSVQGIMHRRASTVGIQPILQHRCLSDLAQYCSTKPEMNDFGGDIECLQDNIQQLEPACLDVVSNYTVIEATDVSLNRAIQSYCRPSIERFCSNDISLKKPLNQEQSAQIWNCIVEHTSEPSMSEKCRHGVEHFQILQMKNFKFNPELAEHCKTARLTYCPESKTVGESIYCLARVVLAQKMNFRIKGQLPNVGMECRERLSSKYLMMVKNPKLRNYSLKEACKDDLINYCSNVKPGGGRVLKCLQKNLKRITPNCASELRKFNVAGVELGATYRKLFDTCSLFLKEHCHNRDGDEGIFECLRQNLPNYMRMDDSCRSEIVSLLITLHHSPLVDSALMENCKTDLETKCYKVFASNEFNDIKSDDLRNQVYDCLVEEYRNVKKRKNLEENCQTEISLYISEEVIDVRLNEQLQKHCENDLKTLCPRTPFSKKEECLFTNYERVIDNDCKRVIESLLKDMSNDVHMDLELQSSCSVDLLKYCSTVQIGDGRRLRCLVRIFYEDMLHGNGTFRILSDECHHMVSRRVNLFNQMKYDVGVSSRQVNSLTDLKNVVVNTKNRSYLWTILISIFLIIFFMAMMVGRWTKRQVERERKII
ncbi:hypothetical protein SNEBB_009743 [Seison nebaliae]|nr:hypothetical protein SNEBB_009743 [Seison nebaliae]